MAALLRGSKLLGAATIATGIAIAGINSCTYDG